MQYPGQSPTSHYWTVECPGLWIETVEDVMCALSAARHTSTISHLLGSSKLPDTGLHDVEPYSVLF